MRHKLKIHCPGGSGHHASVYLDGEQVWDLKSVIVKIEAGDINTVTLTYVDVEVEIDAEVEAENEATNVQAA